jgi:hypothetical protein
MKTDWAELKIDNPEAIANAYHAQGVVQGEYNAVTRMSHKLKTMPVHQILAYVDEELETAIANWRRLDK